MVEKTIVEFQQRNQLESESIDPYALNLGCLAKQAYPGAIEQDYFMNQLVKVQFLKVMLPNFTI